MKRLAKDYQDFKNSEIPLVGVAAVPDEHDMRVWHINIRGQDDTLWHGAVFHMIMIFPKDYPLNPPKIKLFTPLTHPNVHIQERQRIICLEQLSKQPTDQRRWYEGWQSAYTVESILIQLQSFLSEKSMVAATPVEREVAKQEVEAANAFKCNSCRHRGSIDLFPPFNETTTEQFISLKTLKTEKQLLQAELLCYHTKMPLAQTTLGVGVALTRALKTSQVNNVFPTLDLLSNKAFTKGEIRKSIANEPFNYWLPLYFGESQPYEVKKLVYDEETKTNRYDVKMVDPLQRFQHLLKKKLCFMTMGSAQAKFEPSMALQILPKLIVTQLVQLAEDKKHHSIIAIRRLFNFIRVFSMLLELHPELKTAMDQRLKEFITKPESRIKEKTPSLGDILVYQLVSSQTRLRDLLQIYIDEQLDRQVFWIVEKVPELDHTHYNHKNKNIVVEENRSEVCFKTGLTAFHLTLIVYELSTLFEAKYNKDLKAFDVEVDSNFGCLPSQVESSLQQKIKQVKKVLSFKQYFLQMGFACPDDDALTLRLRQAIDNSYRKKYHGSYSHGVPYIGTQLAEMLKKEPYAFSYYDENKKTFRDASDPCWQKACFDRFPKVRQLATAGLRQLTAAEIAALWDSKTLGHEPHLDCLHEMIRAEMHGNYRLEEILGTTAFEDYPGDFNWRNLFHKLVFEQFLACFARQGSNRSPLKNLYMYLDALAPELTVISIQVDQKRFKSKNYWLMVVLSRLTNLRSLTIHLDPQLYCMERDFFKFMKKGLAYNAKNGGCLGKISFRNMLGPQMSNDMLYSVLKTQPSLVCLNLSHNKIGIEDAKAIKRALQTLRGVRELNLTDSGLSTEAAKEIADGIVQAKKLEVFKLAQNPGVSPNAVNQVIYNLTFLPGIRFINLTKAQCDFESVGSLKRFFQVSGSIETFIWCGSTLFTMMGSGEILIAAGFSKTVRYINFDSDSQPVVNATEALSMAQINAQRGFNLKGLSLKQWFSKDCRWPASALVSTEQIEGWESGKNVQIETDSEKMRHYLGLEYIDLSNSDFSQVGSGFNKKEILKQKKPDWPSYLRLSSTTPIAVVARNVKLNETSANFLEVALTEEAFGPCQITKLDVAQNNFGNGTKLLASALAKNASIIQIDISQCGLGVAGIQSLANALKQNSTIKWLNLYRNLIDVDGARALAEALKVNRTLQFLDIGFNRIRNTGIKAISEALSSNIEASVHRLAIRANFITDEGIGFLFDKLVFHQTPQLTHLFMKHNLMNEHFKIDLHLRLKTRINLVSLEEHESAFVAGTTQITYGSQWEVPRVGFEALVWADQKQVFVDEFQTIEHLEEGVQKRSIWMAPMPKEACPTEGAISKKMQDWSCGMVTDVRIRRGRKVKGRAKENVFVVVEFACEASVIHTIEYQAKYGIFNYGEKQKAYRAGTRTANPLKAFLATVRDSNKKRRKQTKLIK